LEVNNLSVYLKAKNFRSMLLLFLILAGQTSYAQTLIQQLRKGCEIEGVTFSVQVAAWDEDPKNISAGFILDCDQVSCKVLYGSYTNYAEALNARDSLEKIGHKGPWVPFFHNDKSVSYEQIRAMVRRQELQVNCDPPSLQPAGTQEELTSSPSLEDSVHTAETAAFQVDELDEESLVVKAKSAPFKPFYKLKSRVMDDLKLIILLGILGIFILFSLGLVVAMIWVKRMNKIKHVLKEKYKAILREPLSQLMFDQETEDIKAMSYEQIADFFPKELLSNKLFRQIIINELISLNKSFKGEFKDKIKMVYRKLNLHTYSIGKLKSRKWGVVTKGLVEINEMDLEEAVPKINSLSQHRNFYIRSYAVATLLNLSNDKNLTYLANQSYPLSRWQQITYLRIIRYLSKKEQVKLSYLLDSKNVSVRIFAIKLVNLLGRVDLLEKMAEIFPAAEVAEKKEIVRSFAALHASSYADVIVTCFAENSEELKISAAEALGILGDKDLVPLILKELEGEIGFQYKMSLMKCLKSIDTVLYEIWANDHLATPYVGLIQRHLEDRSLVNV
jgi:hypothetical protein